MENVKDAHPVLTIRVLGDSPIQPAFEALVADACESIPSALDDLLDGLYLYGSVARGCAVPGQSDLDLTLVLTGNKNGNGVAESGCLFRGQSHILVR
ncbi:nucleotidyltransferase domain-containing protein [Pandoraea sp. PE-S2T-3]|uniref:nucleotidyltransferase domain-containing protein n=1 Tax=Pandoraea sp. PE-S2T-3 TaxID=1986993 RepID=UPI0034E85541